MRCSKCDKSMPMFSDFCPRCGGRPEGDRKKKTSLDQFNEDNNFFHNLKKPPGVTSGRFC